MVSKYSIVTVYLVYQYESYLNFPVFKFLLTAVMFEKTWIFKYFISL